MTVEVPPIEWWLLLGSSWMTVEFTPGDWVDVTLFLSIGVTWGLIRGVRENVGQVQENNLASHTFGL